MKVLVLGGLGTILVFGLGGQPVVGGLSLSKQCGDITCQEHQYCSNFDHRCHPCQDVCDPITSNYQSSVCEAQCQDYIHDNKYVTKNGSGGSSYEQEIRSKLVKSLESYIDTLVIIVILALVMTSLMFLAVVLLVGVYIHKTRRKKCTDRVESNDMALFAQKLQSSEGVVSNNNFGQSSATTLSLSVPPSKVPSNHRHHQSPDAAVAHGPNESRESTNTATTPGTPGTCVTTLSTPTGSMRRHHRDHHHHFRREPSESAAPEYAYDNPALAPSPAASDNNANDSFDEKTNRRQTEL